MTDTWQELARKRRALKVSKYKSGGCVSGAKAMPKLGKYARGGSTDDKDFAEKHQPEQETAWNKMKKGGGINIKPSHKGLLHKDLGVAKGKKIPEAKLEKAKNSSNPAERKRATFAENEKHWNKK